MRILILIHERLKNVYRGETVDVSSVQHWVCRCGEAVEGNPRLLMGACYLFAHNNDPNPHS